MQRDNLGVQVTRIGNQVNDLLPNPVVGRRGEEKKIIDWNGADQRAQMMTLCVYSFINATTNPAIFVGPLVGRCEFGSGGGTSEFEFDIPTSKRILNSNNGAVPPPPGDVPLLKGDGVILSVPASRVGIYARNDANAGLNILEAVNTTIGTFPQSQAHVGAFSAYSVKDSRIFRTLVWAREAAGELAPGASRTVAVPAYARRVIFPRFPMSSTIEVSITDLWGGFHGVYTIPAQDVGNATNPIFLDLTPYDFLITITNTSAAPIVTGLCRFELAL